MVSRNGTCVTRTTYMRAGKRGSQRSRPSRIAAAAAPLRRPPPVILCAVAVVPALVTGRLPVRLAHRLGQLIRPLQGVVKAGLPGAHGGNLLGHLGTQLLELGYP